MSASGGELFMPEFITDITATINEAGYKDKGRLAEILQAFNPEKKGSCYKVRGNYEKIERLSNRLLALNHQLSPVTRGQTHQQHSVRSVDVSWVVMNYIQKKCTKELEKIQDDGFIIEIQPDLRTARNKPGVKVQVTFTPQHVSIHPVHVNFVRQRFISFYQRTASDLQVTSLRVNPQDHKDLLRRFPRLLFKLSHNKNELIVTGPFMHIAKLEEYLLRNTPSPSKSPVNKGPASSSTLSPAPTHSKDPEDETCPICMEPIVTTAKKTLRCKHSFCRDCLKTAFDYKPVCPTCGQVYGKLTGTQPDGGKMTVTTNTSSLPGYKQCGTIIVNYYIPSGIQKEEHPNPGQPYEGVSRTAYFPDSPEGRRIIELLRQAFDQKLIFTVGRSTTSGRNNTVTWNDIHHKTSTHGGPTNYGYPDPEYLSRVWDELKVKGIE